MSKTIPNNKILQSKGLGDTLGDIVSSFNLDLSSNYGAVKTNRMKKVLSTTNLTELNIPLAFAKLADIYYLISSDSIFKGGNAPSDTFAWVDPFTIGGIGVENGTSDMKVFNNFIYVSEQTGIVKITSAGVFDRVVSSGLTSSPHLMEVLNSGAVSRLYITDNYSKIRSINTSNVLTSDGQAYSLNLNLDTSWTITSIKKANSLLWIGLLNTENGSGMVINWDGASADARNATFELPSGVVAGTVLDNTFYIIDTQGIIKKYAGSAFTEVTRIPKKNMNFFSGAISANNSRFVHPNGMTVTDRGTILINISNLLGIGSEVYEDSVPSGIWEYDSNVGLYHKYGLGISDVGGTTLNDYGQQRISNAGAVFFNKPVSAASTDNGILLAGCTYWLSATSTPTYGVFCDDTLDTTQKWGYFISSFMLSETEDVWQKIYTTYKKLNNTTDKIIVKYRTEDETPTTASITWTDIDRFTTVTDISAYGVGDEIQVIQGTGSGKSAHIKEIVGSTYILDDNFPTAVIGLTAKVNLEHWIKAGTFAGYDEMKQLKAFTLASKNTSPFIQIKVCMQFTGKNELYKLRIINNKEVKE